MSRRHGRRPWLATVLAVLIAFTASRPALGQTPNAGWAVRARPSVAVGPDSTLSAIGGYSRRAPSSYLATVEAYTPFDGALGGAFLPSGAPAGSTPSGE